MWGVVEPPAGIKNKQKSKYLLTLSMLHLSIIAGT